MRLLRHAHFHAAWRQAAHKLGKEFGRTVVVPSSSTWTSIQQLMPISRFVADNFKRSCWVAIKILARIGSVVRFETAWLTMERPRLRSCCLHVIFTGLLPPDASYDNVSVSIPYSAPTVNQR